MRRFVVELIALFIFLVAAFLFGFGIATEFSYHPLEIRE